MEPGVDQRYPGNLTEMAFLVVENEKLRRKLKKAQQRRDHYARLYYRVTSEMDRMKWELRAARNKLQKMKSQAPAPQPQQPQPNDAQLHSSTDSAAIPPLLVGRASPDSGTSFSPAVESINPQFAPEPKPANFTDGITAMGLPKPIGSPATQQAHLPSKIPVVKGHAKLAPDPISQPHPLLPRPSFNFSQTDSPLIRAKRGSQSPPPPLERVYTLSQPTDVSSPGVACRPAFEHALSMPYEDTWLTPGPRRKYPLDRAFLSQDDCSSQLSAFRKPIPMRGAHPRLHPQPESSSHSDRPDVSSGASCSEHSTSPVASSQKMASPEYCSECRCSGLSGVEMLDLLARISDPNCTITKLEISNSQLGQPEAMGLLCKDLVRNRSVTELSLPSNGINNPSLKILFDCVLHCDNIKELTLRNNDIGIECVEVIKSFLSSTTLDSLVLTGNEIEQYGHLLNDSTEFTLEYDAPDGSDDSGLVADPDNEEHLHRFKYLHI